MTGPGAEDTPDHSSNADYRPVRATSVHSTEGSDRLSTLAGSVPAYRDDALRAIEALGTSAQMRVRSGTLMHIGEWLDWPDWLCDGTSLGCGPLPTYITAADDILIVANVLEHADVADLLSRLLEHGRPALGPRAGLFYANAPTLGEALEVMARAVNANNPSFIMSVERVGANVRLSVRPAVALGRIFDLIGPATLVLTYNILRALIPDQVHGLMLETTYHEPKSPASIAQLFRCQIRVGGVVNALSFPARLLARRNPESDPSLWLLARENFEAFERTRQSAPIVDRVRARVLSLLVEEACVPRLKQVAAYEGLSSRTVIRKLSQSSTSFHQVVEEERRRMAAQLINDSSLSLQAISEALGFTDRSSFGRSFRKWFGKPPGEFRKTVTT